MESRRFVATGRSLDNREAEVLIWLAEGKTAEEIGLIVGRSRMTVQRVLAGLRTHFDAPTNACVVGLAFASGDILTGVA